MIRAEQFSYELRFEGGVICSEIFGFSHGAFLCF